MHAGEKRGRELMASPPDAPRPAPLMRRARVDTLQPSDFVSVTPDGLTVVYTGRGNHSNDWGTALATSVWGGRLAQLGRLGYFEVEVLAGAAP